MPGGACDGGGVLGRAVTVGAYSGRLAVLAWPAVPGTEFPQLAQKRAAGFS
jgi:hypothetical protein